MTILLSMSLAVSRVSGVCGLASPASVQCPPPGPGLRTDSHLTRDSGQQLATGLSPTRLSERMWHLVGDF